MLAPLLLNESRCSTLELRRNTEVSEVDQSAPLSLQIETRIGFNGLEAFKETPPEAIVILNIKNAHKPEDYPLIFEIEYQGTFLWHGDIQTMDDGKLRKLFQVNGAALLYGQMREMFSLVSSRMVGIPLPMPTLSPMKAFLNSAESNNG